MHQTNLILELAYLYPKLLNIYGDTGNVLTLQYRCSLRKIKLNVVAIGINEEIDKERFDLYFIGGGQDQEQAVVSGDLQFKKNELIYAIENGAVFLAICGGYQLLGKYYKGQDGAELKGLEALDLYTVCGNKRMIGNVLCRELESKKILVGFENHSGKTYLGQTLKPLAKVINGNGNNGEDNFEGVRHKNVFGSYLHGSLLPKNPHLADKLISLALERKGLKMPDTKIDDQIEIQAYKKAISLR